VAARNSESFRAQPLCNDERLMIAQLGHDREGTSQITVTIHYEGMRMRQPSIIISADLILVDKID
jgi:hypothetical protein